MRRQLAIIALITVAAGHAPRASGDLWSTPVTEPSDYERYMSLADRHAVQAMEIHAEQMRRVRRRARDLRTVVARAVSFYERAAEVRPDAAEPHYRAAELIHHRILEGPRNTPVISLRDLDYADSALSHWQAFERLAPLDPRVTDTLGRRAIINTKLVGTGHGSDEDALNRAIDNYEQLLRRADSASIHPGEMARRLANLAETYMMVGRIGDAITHYERALDFSNEPLYGYGLAVALDRDEQGVRARQIMASYADGDRMRSLLRDSVFFVPDGERYYYTALGHEALGDLDAAIEHYRAFIASGAHPRYRPRAADNLRGVLRRRRTGATIPRLPRGLGL